MATDNTSKKHSTFTVAAILITIMSIVIIFTSHELSVIRINAFDEGRAVGRGEMSLECTKLALDSTPPIFIPQTKPSPSPEKKENSSSERQSL